jgi:hypothetical protein
MFGLLELEMVDLSCFFEKNDLRLLGVKENSPKDARRNYEVEYTFFLHGTNNVKFLCSLGL